MGLYDQSDVYRINPLIGDVINKVEMDSKYFAEGMTIFETESGEKRLIQIIWKAKTSFIYNADTLKQLSTFE